MHRKLLRLTLPLVLIYIHIQPVSSGWSSSDDDDYEDDTHYRLDYRRQYKAMRHARFRGHTLYEQIIAANNQAFEKGM